MLHALLAAASLAIVPLHATVLDARGANAIVRTDAVPLTLDASARRVKLDPPVRLESGVGIDAYLDRSTRPWTLHDPTIAGRFAPGMPQPGRVIPVDVGGPLPSAELVDQNGKLLQLDRAFAGKTVVLSFVFTRCPDRTLCPAISGKFAYMQSHLDPAKFALVEITLDPPYDSPAILQRYGAQYGAQPRVWTLLTGKGSTIQKLLDEFRIDSLRVSTDNFLHNDKLFIVSPLGRVASIVDTASWDPQGVIAQANEVAGIASNPFERFKLSLIAGVAAFCGGSQFAGVVLLELVLFFFIIVVVVAALWAVARVLWSPGRGTR
ncbi:MAG: SCO family protein [Candidatus Eremiobacteraeota bacterium]|nr:SCO family protein [Candidatus Eremiobacteraeota bacterium]